ncbi:unnamed protein product [Parnassius apollo]|uniref:(apollo) hypothetical protein n=1 Tax=Parnassius apollo TaxID=110799 RepID=A0A8S3W7R0_PARAO|nr:unnamed protein product [Parnassius apollo]
MEPIMMQSTQTDTWDGSPENPPKRRRPIRKHKRRPHPGSAEIPIPQEVYTQQQEYQPYNEDKYRSHTEMPQRRRKKIDTKPTGWNEEIVEQGRPLQRKNQRRKRPAQEPWHELSEFGDFSDDENPSEKNVRNQKPRITSDETEDDNNENRKAKFTLKQFYNEERKRDPDEARDVTEEEDEDEPSQFPIEQEENNAPQTKQDKSLSEFSLENVNPIITPETRNEAQLPYTGNFNDVKEQKNRPLDPASLKEILKKSKGKSLSELLQMHNLTLADLLNGEKNVLSVLKSTDSPQNEEEITTQESTSQMSMFKIAEPTISINADVLEIKRIENENVSTISEELISTTVRYFSPGSQASTDKPIKPSFTTIDKYKLHKNLNSNINQTDNSYLTETNATALRRRFPVDVRMKLRMRPVINNTNNTYKGQVSRDMMASTTKRYQNSRNITKLRDWKEIFPAITNKTQSKSKISQEEKDNLTTTTNLLPEEITITQYTTQFNPIYTKIDTETQTESLNTDTESITTMASVEITTEEKSTTTKKPISSSSHTPILNITNVRQRAFANRLNKKRMKQKVSSNETSEDHLLKGIFDMANLVSASEFIAKVHPRTTTSRDQSETVSMLEDFMTTEPATKAITQISTKRSKTREHTKSSTTPRPTISISTTEKTSNIEIEEILNDTSTSARLSKILMERNMTLSELVEHRERGSSHIHLADIFHNASKEPNPPEPFLSKSLIEPISKETYPLRALLEANLHDPTIKAPTIEPYLMQPQYINIPIVMDFGNNVNENGENSGVTPLRNNFTKKEEQEDIVTTNKASTYQKIKTEETIHDNFTNRTSRQSRIIGNEHDLVTLNEILTILHHSHDIIDDESQISSNDLSSPNTFIKQTILEEDIDGDGLIALEDIQRIKDLQDNSFLYNNKIELKSLDSQEATIAPSTPETINNNTKSVTVVTASIMGLIAVLFLLTYAAFKWQHQQQMYKKKQCAGEERIPTPVFENRRSNKNSSIRSMSPILTSNIYSVNTLEKGNTNECSEYMWDSLRKPFQ